MGLVRARLFLYLLYTIVLHYHMTTCSLDVNLASTRCPYMRFCSKEPLLIVHGEDETPCCLPCSCDSDCIHLQNCCPDYEMPPGEPPTPTTSCRSTGYNGADSKLYYYTRDSCPADFIDTGVASKCRGDDVESWKDIVMVWSPLKKEIYLNIYCAQCHGVTDALFWRVRHTDCPIMSTVDTLPLPKELPTKCKISFEPPNPKAPNVLTKTCFPESMIVSDCLPQPLNASKADYRYLWERCESSQSTIYLDGDAKLGVTVYKNVYCYMCNNLNSTLTDIICSKDWVPDPEKGDAGQNVVPFTMVLNIALMEEETRTECQSSEVYDELKVNNSIQVLGTVRHCKAYMYLVVSIL